MNLPHSFETFRRPSSFSVGQWEQKEPDCFNSIVSIRKYRITIEEIPESKDVLIERLRKLWRENDNHHHYGPLRAEAVQLGIVLTMSDQRRGK